MAKSAFDANDPSKLPYRNPPLALMAGVMVRVFELLRIRGAPTLLSYLSKIRLLNRVVAKVRLGAHWIVFPAYDPFWCRHLWAAVPYEPEIEQVFRKLGSGRFLIDGGANLGYWSIRATEFGFKQVIAVEANAAIMPLLVKNFALNKIKGTALNAAIHSESGQRLFLGRTDTPAAAAISSHGTPVNSVNIADLCRSFPPETQVVAKLDVEGSEIEALKGALGVEDITFIYEDFPETGMQVTKFVLLRRMAVFGVTASGECQDIKTVEDAIAFNKRTTRAGSPSNLVTCRAERAGQTKRDLSA